MTTLTNADLAAIRKRYKQCVHESDYADLAEHIPALLDTIAELRAENERLREALRQVCNWSDAYPEDFFLFAEPDWIKARELLEAGGITLDSVSAGAIRRAVTDIGATSRAALEGGKASDG